MICTTLSILSVKSIVALINNVTKGLKDIAQGEGDLTTRLKIMTKDEIGELAEWFNMFIKNLQTMIKTIASNSETITSSSVKLSDLAEKKSAAEDMLGKSTSVTTVTEEMTATINYIAEITGQAKNIADETVKQAKITKDNENQLGVFVKQIENITETFQKFRNRPISWH